MSKRTIITIGRQFGSGGRIIGQKLAQVLQVPFYDKELITLAAEKTGFSPEVFQQADEKAANSFLYAAALNPFSLSSQHVGNLNMPINDKLFLIQSNIIKEVAAEGSCVIIGRCANDILKNNPDCLNLFIYAPMAEKIQRAINDYQMPAARVEESIEKIDKRRATYYNYYADSRWGKINTYHLAIDSSVLGIEQTVQLLAKLVEIKEGHRFPS